MNELLGSYRIHGANLWATDVVARMHDPRPPDLGAWQARTLKEKMAHARAVIKRSGRRIPLPSTWVRWSYVELRIREISNPQKLVQALGESGQA